MEMGLKKKWNAHASCLWNVIKTQPSDLVLEFRGWMAMEGDEQDPSKQSILLKYKINIACPIAK